MKIESITATIEWRHIPGYEGRYMASTSGEVMRLCRTDDNKLTGGKSFFPSRVLSPKKGNAGYLELQLTDKNYETKTWLVHRLIAKTFLGAKDGDGLVVNHKDGDKFNNALKNLELVTPKENTAHAIVTGLRRPRKLTPEQVSDIFNDYEHGMGRTELAYKYHVHIDTIDKWLSDYKKGKIEWLEK